MLKVVVFPDPLGPMSPKISPCATSKETPSTAASPPKYLTSLTIWKYATNVSSGPGVEPEHAFSDLRPVADDPVGKDQDHQDHQDPEPEDVRLGQNLGDLDQAGGPGDGSQPLEEAEEAGAEQLLDGDHHESADGRAVDRPDAAHDPDEDRHDRDVVQVEDDGGVDEPHVVHVEGTGDPRPEGRVRQGEHLVEVRVDPETLRGVLVFPDGDEIVPRLGV